MEFLEPIRYVKQVVLDDRYQTQPNGTRICIGYKPTRKDINELTKVLPNCRILGFTPYYLSIWCLLVEDQSFTSPDFTTITRLRGNVVKADFTKHLP